MSKVVTLLLSLAVLVALVMLSTSTERYRKSQTPPTILLPMTFAHIDHTEQQCVACHHNYQDDTGQGLCLECHRTDETVNFLIEEQFHDLCMGCHTGKNHKNEETGPMRHCAACHTQDHLP